jgi:hypothetical protein
LRKKLRKNARITALEGLWLVDLMNRLPVEPAAFPLSLKRSSRSTEIPARTGPRLPQAVAQKNVSVANDAVFDPETIADMANNLTRLERALYEFAR